jgi:FG-GAP-like repeat
MGYVLASLVNGAMSGTESLVAQTDTLAPITVATTTATGLGTPTEATQEFGATSVTSNVDGSFDVFWSVFTLTSGVSFLGPDTEFEQEFSASGEALGSAKTLSTIGSPDSSLFSWASATPSGGYVLPSVSSSIDPSTEADTETLVVQTDTLAPITVTTLTNPENSQDSQSIVPTGVSSNTDGSFDVFWSDFSGEESSPTGNFLVAATQFEQAYSATGQVLGSAKLIATAPSNSSQRFVAATATADGGYVLASESGSIFGGDQTLLVQTDKLAPFTVTIVSASSTEIDDAWVASNADGSFDVFWSLATLGSTQESTEFEQAYSASGEALGAAVPIATGSSATRAFVAATGTSSAGGSTPPSPVTADILWQNRSTGQASIWEMDGSALVGGGAVSPSPGPSWTEIGTGDFNKDGQPDILWQNASTGQASIWEMNGSSLIGGGAVTPNPGPSWRAIGTGDFNHDGFSDILWQNTNTGQASIWEMSGASLSGGGPVTPNPGPAWKAIGTGDFNHDGFSDILWQNANTGQVSIWEMHGNTLIEGGPVTPNPGTAWQAIGTGDFNHDGFSDDILFQNKNTGQVSVWEMDGASLIGGGPVSANPGTSWHATEASGGGSDILLQNTSGQTSIWEMNGNTIAGGGPVSPNPGPSWHAIGLT